MGGWKKKARGVGKRVGRERGGEKRENWKVMSVERRGGFLSFFKKNIT